MGIAKTMELILKAIIEVVVVGVIAVVVEVAVVADIRKLPEVER